MGALIVFGYGPGISHATAERFGLDRHRPGGETLWSLTRTRDKTRVRMAEARFYEPDCH
jgi:hypothetical protein